MKIKKISSEELKKISFNIFTWTPNEETLFYCPVENELHFHARVDDYEKVKFPRISFLKPFYKSHEFSLSKGSLMILYKGQTPKEQRNFKEDFLKESFPGASIRTDVWRSFINEEPIVFFMRPDFNTMILLLESPPNTEKLIEIISNKILKYQKIKK